MINKKSIDVLGIGNAIIDVIAGADDDFLNEHGLNKGSMTLVDDEEVKLIKEKLIEAAKMFGYNEIDGMDKFFERLDMTISELDSKIDN